MNKKYHILVSRYNDSPVSIFVEGEKDKNFIQTLLHNALEDRRKYPNVISVSTVEIPNIEV